MSSTFQKNPPPTKANETYMHIQEQSKYHSSFEVGQARDNQEMGSKTSKRLPVKLLMRNESYMESQ